MADSPYRFCLYVITKDGLDHAQALHERFGCDADVQLDILVSEKFSERCTVPHTPLPLPFKAKIGEQFTDYDAHVFIVSVGAVVRMIAPFIKSKKTDPAVICIDDMAKFTICLLSGHIGRGNEFTQRIATALHSTPVITTASDRKGTLAVDILGRDQGFQLEDSDRNLTVGAAAVVNEQRVLLWQQTGETTFWPHAKPWPKGIHYHTELPEDWQDYEFYLTITDRATACLPAELIERGVIYRPKSLVVGMGCDKGTSVATLRQGLAGTFKEFGLSLKAIAAIATIDIKTAEPGLIALAEELGVPVVSYDAATLDTVAERVPNPSAVVKKYIGTATVAEGAALLASGGEELLVAKQKYLGEDSRNMTAAISRKPFAPRQPLHTLNPHPAERS